MNALPEVPRPDDLRTENDRLKGSFSVVLWTAMIAATLVHFAIFALWPQLHANVVPLDTTAMKTLNITPKVVVPDQPAHLQHPAQPQIASTDVPDDLTMARTDWSAVPVQDLPEPPKEHSADISREPTLTPYTVAPEILNKGQVVRALMRSYPALLREAGIGGTVKVYFFIDENGVVRDRRIAVSSGHPQLDSAALKVAGVYRFSPAMNMDRKTAVWVQFPITFEIQ